MKVWRTGLIPAGITMLLVLVFVLDPKPLLQAARFALNHPLGLLAAFTAYTAAFGLRALSWRELLRERIPPKTLFALVMGALFLNHAAPAKAGDLARMYALACRGVAGERAVASVVLSRLVDLVGLLMVLAVSWALIGVGEWERLTYPALFVVGAVAALPILYRLRLPARFGALGRYAGRLREALRETTRVMFLRSLAFAAPAWVLEAGILLFVIRGMGIELSTVEVVAATGFAVLVAAMPLTPGALGTYEAGMVAVLVALGVSVELAFAAAVLTHALKFLYAFAAAPFVALGRFAPGRRNLRKGICFRRRGAFALPALPRRVLLIAVRQPLKAASAASKESRRI